MNGRSGSQLRTGWRGHALTSIGQRSPGIPPLSWSIDLPVSAPGHSSVPGHRAGSDNAANEKRHSPLRCEPVF